ncbi:short-chain dehydrogenase [Loigolactobacillus backii]|uniref:SDR family NAD(P)-dependent oxidoreductase n=1 Tax=Loigolactobacillus TaxID=2767889 RepID=UPI000C1CB1E1|nr:MULTISPECIES: SDR family NAD(P)-dependent oxidoreductase [Loigolactobacillus]PIO82381.1 short-chain dehydrogenase [Loigolactobacillus backii]
MDNFKDRVILITGSAHGFGAAIAKEAAQRGMKLALADIDEPALKDIYDEVTTLGADAEMIPTDVTEETAVDNAVATTMKRFGQIDVLVNSAGVAVPGSIWELPTRDWEWILHADVMSQVYALQQVIPIMMKQPDGGDIINVASMAGLITSPLMPAYYTSKFASVGMTEAVEYDLQAAKANVHMHVFCPAFVQTDLYHSEQHRPAKYTNTSDPYYTSKVFKDGQKFAENDIKTGMSINTIPALIFTALEKNEFYILSHPAVNPLIVARAQGIVNGQGPDLNLITKYLDKTHGEKPAAK